MLIFARRQMAVRYKKQAGENDRLIFALQNLPREKQRIYFKIKQIAKYSCQIHAIWLEKSLHIDERDPRFCRSVFRRERCKKGSLKVYECVCMRNRKENNCD